MVDLRLVALAFLLAAAPAQARPGDLDRAFAGDGRTAYAMHGGGAVYGLAVTDGRRALVSVGSPYGTQPATLALTAGGRLARRTALGPPAVGPPSFANGHALTRTGPAQYTLTRIGEATGVTLTGVGEWWGFGVDGAGRAVLTFGTPRGRGRWRTTAARYLPSGALDRSYGRDGVAVIGNLEARPAFVRRDGRLYLIADRDKPSWRVLVLDADGRRRSGVAPRGGRFARLEGPTNLLPAPGGRLLVTGADSSQSGWIARLGADGRPDRRFGVRGLLRLRRFTPYDLALDRRGRIVLAGAGGRALDATYDGAVVRLTVHGRRDRTFPKATVKFGRLRGLRLAGSEARFIRLDDRGRILIAGEAYDENYMSRDDSGFSYPAVARLLG